MFSVPAAVCSHKFFAVISIYGLSTRNMQFGVKIHGLSIILTFSLCCSQFSFFLMWSFSFILLSYFFMLSNVDLNFLFYIHFYLNTLAVSVPLVNLRLLAFFHSQITQKQLLICIIYSNVQNQTPWVTGDSLISSASDWPAIITFN